MKNKYAIIDIITMDFMKDKKGVMMLFNTAEHAASVCGIYEFEDVWVVKFEYNHKEI